MSKLIEAQHAIRIEQLEQRLVDLLHMLGHLRENSCRDINKLDPPTYKGLTAQVDDMLAGRWDFRTRRFEPPVRPLVLPDDAWKPSR